MIQDIEKQGNGWHMVIHFELFYLKKKLHLFTKGLQPSTDNGLTGSWLAISK